MDHPLIAQTMRTGYPVSSYLQYEINPPEGQHLEDMFGSEIKTGDIYFVDSEKNIVHKENLEDYLIEIVGVLFYEA